MVAKFSLVPPISSGQHHHLPVCGALTRLSIRFAGIVLGVLVFTSLLLWMVD